MSGNQDYNLVRPDDAFNRKNGAPGASHFRSKHERKIADYLKMEKIRIEECVFILGSLKKCLPLQYLNQIKLVHPDITTATQQNIEEILGVLIFRYAGYTIEKGEENFNKLQDIPNFMSIQLINDGLAQMSKLYLERVGWNTVVPLTNYDHDDGSKLSLLYRKMRGWDKLDFVLQTSKTVVDTYQQACTRLLQKADELHRLEIGDSNAAARLQRITTGVPAVNAGILDSGYQVFLAKKNAGALDPEYQAYLQQQQKHQDKDVGEDEYAVLQGYTDIQNVQCYNCKQYGHYARQCTRPHLGTYSGRGGGHRGTSDGRSIMSGRVLGTQYTSVSGRGQAGYSQTTSRHAFMGRGHSQHQQFVTRDAFQKQGRGDMNVQYRTCMQNHGIKWNYDQENLGQGIKKRTVNNIPFIPTANQGQIDYYEEKQEDQDQQDGEWANPEDYVNETNAQI